MPDKPWMLVWVLDNGADGEAERFTVCALKVTELEAQRVYSSVFHVVKYAPSAEEFEKRFDATYYTWREAQDALEREVRALNTEWYDNDPKA